MLIVLRLIQGKRGRIGLLSARTILNFELLIIIESYASEKELSSLVSQSSRSDEMDCATLAQSSRLPV
jgi:hypothetical protein